MVRGENESTQRGNAERGNDVQGQPSSARESGNTNNDKLLLQEGGRIAEEIRSKNVGAELSSPQRGLLAAQYAISRELVFRDARLAAIKENIGLEEGKPTSLDEIAAILEKYNKDKEVKALFDKILSINKRLGTSIQILSSDENGNYGSSGLRRDVPSRLFTARIFSNNAATSLSLLVFSKVFATSSSVVALPSLSPRELISRCCLALR